MINIVTTNYIDDKNESTKVNDRTKAHSTNINIFNNLISTLNSNKANSKGNDDLNITNTSDIQIQDLTIKSGSKKLLTSLKALNSILAKCKSIDDINKFVDKIDSLINSEVNNEKKRYFNRY